MAVALPLPPPPLTLVPPPARRVGGRPRLDIPNRPTVCPRGHHGSIRIHGNPRWKSRPFRRPRFLCLPDDPAEVRHTFSGPRRPAHDAHPQGESCSTCDVVPGLAQGPLTPVHFETSANEMAKVLVLAGAGDSGRKAAQAVRYDAQRYEVDEHGFRYASRAFGLAGRYIDLFGDLVHRALAPDRWPRILILDSKPLNLYPYDAAARGERWDSHKRAGAVLAAVGGNDPARPLRAWGLHLAADETKESWADFLAELPGDVEWVVADGAKAIKQAAMLRWPNAKFVACEFHLGRALDDWAARDGWPAENPEIKPLLDRAFLSPADWDALLAFADDHDAENILTWMTANDERVRGQIELRLPEFDRYPRSNSPAEGLLNFVDRKLYRRRRFRFRNAPRLQTILNLMRASEAGQAGQAEYAAIIKRHLAEEGPSFVKPDWEAGEDDPAQLRSLSRLLLAARDRAQQASAIYMADAKARSVLARIAEDNAERQRMGFPPLTWTAKPGQRTLSVDVAGTMLTDYPEIARDWDYEKNTRAIGAITAGSDYEAAWVCHACGHTWNAEVGQRTKRRTRCERCTTARTTAAQSVAGVRPDLVPEWDDRANAPKTPLTIKATYAKTVVWTCPDPRHKPYRMSPRARVKVPLGMPACPDCKKIQPKTIRSAAIIPLVEDDLPF